MYLFRHLLGNLRPSSAALILYLIRRSINKLITIIIIPETIVTHKSAIHMLPLYWKNMVLWDINITPALLKFIKLANLKYIFHISKRNVGGICCVLPGRYFIFLTLRILALHFSVFKNVFIFLIYQNTLLILFIPLVLFIQSTISS